MMNSGSGQDSIQHPPSASGTQQSAPHRTVPPARSRLVVVAGLAALLSAGVAAAGDDSASSQFALAKLAAEEGRFEEALERFDGAIALEPGDATLRVEFADFLFRFQRPEQSLEQIAEARRLAPEDPAVLRTYGQIHLANAGERPELVPRAVEALEELRAIDSGDLMGMVTLAQAYEGTGRAGEAADVIGELVRQHNDNQRLKRYWIDLLSRAGRRAEATEVLREVVQLEEESLQSRLELAEREADEGNHSAAIDLLEQARTENSPPQLIESLAQQYLARSQSPGLTRSRRDADLEAASSLADTLPGGAGVNVRARALALSERIPEAISLLEGSVDGQLEDLPNLMLLSSLYERDDRLDQAAEVLDRVVELVPEDRRLPLERERVLFHARSENWERVADLTARLVEDAPADELGGLRALRLDALVRLGRHRQALAILRDQGGDDPPPENLMARAEVYADQGRDRDARRMLDEAEGDDPLLLRRRAGVLLRLGDVEAARRVIDSWIGEADAPKLLAAGQFLSSEGAFAEAERYLRRAIELEGGEGDEDLRAGASFLLGQALERQGRIDEAADSFRQVLAVRGDDPLALNYLGYMLADAGRDLEEAVALIRRAVDIDPLNGAYQDSLGWALYRLGNFEAARDTLEKASRLDPRNATILDHLGDAHMALGSSAEARAAWLEALELATDEAERESIRKKLEDLDAGGSSD